jgi:dTMP kinase
MASLQRGLFVTFEGCDGCGKTTAIKEVDARLTALGIPHLLTREPGGSVIAEEIREIILDKKNTAEDPRTEALLYAASRRQHLVEIVLPALAQGKVVLCDRYLDSSLAYQGYARGIGIDEVMSINAFAIDKTMPDVTFFLDLTPEEGLARIAKGHRSCDRLDAETLSFHQKVYEGYQIVNQRFHDRIVIIDAHKTPAGIAEEITTALVKRLKERS